MTCPLGMAATCSGSGPGCPVRSCIERAAWSPAQRAAFDVADARAEALEMEPGFHLPEPDPETPRLRARRASSEDLTGRRFGRLFVQGPTVLERPVGYRLRAWRVRCDCGNEVVMRSANIRRGAEQCQPCARRGLRPTVKLTRSQVRRLRAMRQKGEVPVRQLAAAFGISKSHAHDLGRGRWWKEAA